MHDGNQLVAQLDDLCIDIWVSVMIICLSQHPDNRETWYSNVLWVSECLIVSDLEIAIASPSFASLLYINRLKCLNAPILSALHLRC